MSHGLTCIGRHRCCSPPFAPLPSLDLLLTWNRPSHSFNSPLPAAWKSLGSSFVLLVSLPLSPKPLRARAHHGRPQNTLHPTPDMCCIGNGNGSCSRRVFLHCRFWPFVRGPSRKSRCAGKLVRLCNSNTDPSRSPCESISECYIGLIEHSR